MTCCSFFFLLMKIRVKQFVPKSWFHPLGALNLARELEPRMPSLRNAVAVTLTVDRAPYPDPFFAYLDGTKRSGDMIETFRRRYGPTEYFCGLEFHDDEEGWPHWHMIILRRGTYPMQEIRDLWGRGHVYLQRIKSETFRYFIKYIVKDLDAPEWVRECKRIRRVRFSRGFLVALCRDVIRTRKGLCRMSRTIGERIDAWRKTASVSCSDGTHWQMRILQEWQDLIQDTIDDLVAIKAYSGRGVVELDLNNRKHQLWIRKHLNPDSPPPPSSVPESSSGGGSPPSVGGSSTSTPREGSPQVPSLSSPTSSSPSPALSQLNLTSLCLPRPSAEMSRSRIPLSRKTSTRW